jgi:hypothetical protein
LGGLHCVGISVWVPGLITEHALPKLRLLRAHSLVRRICPLLTQSGHVDCYPGLLLCSDGHYFPYSPILQNAEPIRSFGPCSEAKNLCIPFVRELT